MLNGIVCGSLADGDKDEVTMDDEIAYLRAVYVFVKHSARVGAGVIQLKVLRVCRVGEVEK